MNDTPIIPIVLIAVVVIAMQIIHFIALGFDPALSVLIVFTVAGLVIFAVLNMGKGDDNDK